MSNADVIHVPCPHCDYEFKTRREHVGKSGKCNQCGKTFVISEPHFKTCERCQERMAINAPTCPHCGYNPKKPTLHAGQPVSHSKVTASKGGTSLSGLMEVLLPAATDEHGRTPVRRKDIAPRYWALTGSLRYISWIGTIQFLAAAAAFCFSMKHWVNGETEQAWIKFLAGSGAMVLGLLTVGFAQLLKAIRDMAINSYLTAYNNDK